MNKRAPVLLALGVLLFSTGAAGVSVDTSVQPDSTLWHSEDFEVTATCGETSDQYTVYIENITRGDKEAYGDPGTAVEFARDGNTYLLDGADLRSFLDERYGYTTGKYTFFTRCENDNDVGVSKQSLTVESLVATLEHDLKDAYYAGSQANLSLALQKEGEGSPVNIGANSDPQPTFTLLMDGAERDVSTYYDGSGRYWVLNTDVPNEPGAYDVEIRAAHDGATATVTETVTVKDTLRFGTALDSTQVDPGSTITLTTEAIYRGERLALDADDIAVTFDGDTINDRVTLQDKSSDGSTFAVDLPEKTPGTYSMSVELVRDDTPAAEDTHTVSHPVPVTGTFQQGNELIPYEMTFTQDGDTKQELSGDGAYDTALAPDYYNMSLVFPDAELLFQNTVVDGWEDAMRYRSYDGNHVPGLSVAGLYAYRTALDYDAVDLTLQYDASRVDSLEDLVVYHCDGWNMGGASCYGSWREVAASFDDVDSEVTLAGSEGAYAVGERDRLSIRHSAGDIRSSYTPDQEISFTGLVRDSDGNRVGNASVTMTVDGADTSETTGTGTKGTFAFAFDVPDEAGTYTVDLTVDKGLYRDASTSLTFDVERPAAVDIVTPQNVKMQANTTRNVSFYVENTGYTTIKTLEPQLDIPFLSDFALDTEQFRSGENREGILVLDVPANASTDTYTAEIGFGFRDETVSDTFGLTVEALPEEELTGQNASSETTVGMISRSLPSFSGMDVSMSGVLPDTDDWFQNAVLGIILFQVGIVVFFTVRGRIGGGPAERDEVIRTVNDIKQDVGGRTGDALSAAPNTVTVHRRNDDVERDHVMRTMSHIKSQIAPER